MKIRVHPIQQNYRGSSNAVVCGLCQEVSAPKNPETPARVTHMVHLVREHLAEVQASLSKKGRSEEVLIDVEG